MPSHSPHLNQKKRGIASVIAMVLGSLTAAVGLWFIGAYVFGAIIHRLGEPDQSLLFWYLPLLFIGIACLGAGIGGVVFGILWRRPPSA